MATIPTPATATGGGAATSTQANSWRDTLQYLLGLSMTGGGGRRGFAQMRQTSPQSISDSSFTDVTLNAEDVDYDGGHSTVTNTARYTAQTAGWYLVAGGCSFAANSTGRRGVRYSVNGSTVNGSKVLTPTTASGICSVTGRTILVFLAVNDYVTLQVYQDSGGSLNTSTTTDEQPQLTVEWRSE